MEMTARVWFKDPESRNSMIFGKAIAALGAVNSNRVPSAALYFPYDPHKPDTYSEKYDHRFCFWLENTGNPVNEQSAMKSFIHLGKALGGYVEVSIAGLDFYALGEYIGSTGLRETMDWNQSEKLQAAGIHIPSLDKTR